MVVLTEPRRGEGRKGALSEDKARGSEVKALLHSDLRDELSLDPLRIKLDEAIFMITDHLSVSHETSCEEVDVRSLEVEVLGEGSFLDYVLYLVTSAHQRISLSFFSA